MKNLLFGFLAITLTLASCTKETVMEIPDATDASLLKSFMVTRNIDGSYAVSHDVIDGVSTEYLNNKAEKEIFLFDDSNKNKSVTNTNYNVENNTLDFRFTDENESSLPIITITDSNTIEKSDSEFLLDTYSFSYNDDGTLELVFEVNDGVAVTFDDNNEIHLVEGASTDTNFTKTYTEDADGSIFIQFVQTLENKAVDVRIPAVSLIY